MLVNLASQKKPSKPQALILAPSPQLSNYSLDRLNSLIYSSQVHYLNDTYFFAKEKWALFSHAQFGTLQTTDILEKT